MWFQEWQKHLHRRNSSLAIEWKWKHNRQVKLKNRAYHRMLWEGTTNHQCCLCLAAGDSPLFSFLAHCLLQPPINIKSPPKCGSYKHLGKKSGALAIFILNCKPFSEASLDAIFIYNLIRIIYSQPSTLNVMSKYLFE